MSRLRPKTINKKAFKKVSGKCHLCDNNAYATLDVHRIVAGEDGGKYTTDNAVCLCVLCHRLIHEGTIKIDRWYHSTGGRLLRWIDQNGEERFS